MDRPSKSRSSRAALYKVKDGAGGQIDSRALRAHRRSLDWKSFRSEETNKRRGVTAEDLSPVKEDETQKPPQKVDMRREQLKKWKEQRELKKKLESRREPKKFKVTHLAPGEYDCVKPLRKVSDAVKSSKGCDNVGKRVTRSSVAPSKSSPSKPLPAKRCKPPQKEQVPTARITRAQDRTKVQNSENKVVPSTRTTRAQAAAASKGKLGRASKEPLLPRRTRMTRTVAQDPGPPPTLNEKNITTKRGDIILGHSTGNFTFSAPSQPKPLSPPRVEMFFSGETFFSPISEPEARRCSTPKPNMTKSEPEPSTEGAKAETVVQTTEKTESSCKTSTSSDVWNSSAPAAIAEDDVFRTPRSVTRAARRRTVSMVLALTGSNKKTPKALRHSSIMRHLSPEEGVQVLRHSPMIEMYRRTSKSDKSPTAAPALPLPSFDDMDEELGLASTSFNSNSPYGDFKKAEPRAEGTQFPKSSHPETAASDSEVNQMGQTTGDCPLPERAAIEECAIPERAAVEECAIPERAAVEECAIPERAAAEECAIPERAAIEECAIPERAAIEECAIPERAAVEECAIPERAALEECAIPERAAVGECAIPERAAAEECAIPERAAVEECAIPERAAAEECAIPEKAALEECAIPERAAAEECAIPERAAIEECAMPEKTIEDERDVTDKKDEEEHDVPYFRNLVQSHTDQLNALCKRWQDIGSGGAIPEEGEGEIRTTTGKAQLLICQRFKQFSGLVDNCEYKTGEKETTCQDLQGFWDMVYCQVEDINVKFQGLEKLQANNWVSNQPKVVKKKILKKKQVAKPAAKASRPPARSHFAAFRAQMKQTQQQSVNEPEEVIKTFEGGFFHVASPIRSPKPHCEGGTPSKISGLSVSMITTPSGASPLFKAVMEKSAQKSRSVGPSPLVRDTSTEKSPEKSTNQERSTATRRSLAIDGISNVESSTDVDAVPIVDKVTELATIQDLSASPQLSNSVEKLQTEWSGTSIFTPEQSGLHRQSTRTSSLSCDSRVRAEMDLDSSSTNPSEPDESRADAFSKYLLASNSDNLPPEAPPEMCLGSPMLNSPHMAHSPVVDDVDMASHSKRGLESEFNEHSASAKKRRQHQSAPNHRISAVNPRKRRSISASEQRHSLHRSAISNRTRNRRSVHFSVGELPEQDILSLRMPSTPFNKDSLVPHSRIVETEVVVEPKQKENSHILDSDTPTTRLAKLSMNHSPMRRTRRSTSLALQTEQENSQDEDQGDLMSFSPLNVIQPGSSVISTPPRQTRRQSRLSLL